ncbi:hypothetical protein L3Q82_005329 [Scortum barcoo]|uniref:Uncharacterized protein n=1 Tax=Scortum barcoo TaxID=214431 RepID=A0ACB8VAV9_9TELE|nr:hypothetical protein L3Q82_005329 [Scortum barcoo]
MCISTTVVEVISFSYYITDGILQFSTPLLRSGYHHSLPSSPYTSTAGPDGQRLPPSGTLSSEYLNQGGSTKVLLLICNTAGSGQQAVRFGPPFLMREDRSISWDQLQQSILSELYYLMLNGSQAQNAGPLFKIRVVGGSAAYSYLSPQDSRPLCHPAVDRALKFCGPGGPTHVKLVIEWEHKMKECLFGSIQEEVVKDAESVRNQQQQHLQQHSCTLDECFQLYTKEEQLAPDDAWKCPHCKQLQQGMVKMSLWTLPDILILHLKRFRQVGERRNKLSTLVRFPLTGLDMAPHVVKRSQSMRNLNLGAWPSSWKQPSGQHHQPADMILPHDYLYDLYAVCNHHGGMHGGHYTAYCRNSVDGQWYSYDDSNVDLVPEEEINLVLILKYWTFWALVLLVNQLLYHCVFLTAAAAGRKDLRYLSFTQRGWSSRSLKELPSVVSVLSRSRGWDVLFNRDDSLAISHHCPVFPPPPLTPGGIPRTELALLTSLSVHSPPVPVRDDAAGPEDYPIKDG